MLKWSEMTPRERDALVAEKFMGFPRIEDLVVVPIGHDLRTGDIAAYDFSADIPRFSTSIAAAWGVVQRLIAENHYVALEYSQVTQSWCCTLSDGAGDSRSTPEAICLAALKARGVEIE